MTKAELIHFLEPSSDDIKIVTSESDYLLGSERIVDIEPAYYVTDKDIKEINKSSVSDEAYIFI